MPTHPKPTAIDQVTNKRPSAEVPISGPHKRRFESLPPNHESFQYRLNIFGFLHSRPSKMHTCQQHPCGFSPKAAAVCGLTKHGNCSVALNSRRLPVDCGFVNSRSAVGFSVRREASSTSSGARRAGGLLRRVHPWPRLASDMSSSDRNSKQETGSVNAEPFTKCHSKSPAPRPE